MKEVWNQKEYTVFLKILKANQDLEYREFHSGLGIEKDYLIGVRTPILKKLAKEISKTDYEAFIELNTHSTYEERIIHGFLIGYLKTDIETIQRLLWDFLPYVNNWAICDLICANLKIWYKYPETGLKFVKRCLKHENEWYQRFGFVLLLNYYVTDTYIDFILQTCNNYKTNNYYVNMAIAWLISVCYMKQTEKTRKFLQENMLDPWVQNKSIQKIRESRTISSDEKREVLKWKKKQL